MIWALRFRFGLEWERLEQEEEEFEIRTKVVLRNLSKMHTYQLFTGAARFADQLICGLAIKSCGFFEP